MKYMHSCRADAFTLGQPCRVPTVYEHELHSANKGQPDARVNETRRNDIQPVEIYDGSPARSPGGQPRKRRRQSAPGNDDLRPGSEGSEQYVDRGSEQKESKRPMPRLVDANRTRKALATPHRPAYGDAIA